VGAERIQHGDVQVVRQLIGIQNLRLRSLGVWQGGSEEVGVQACRHVCYSDPVCRYWTYSATGCSVEDPGHQSARASKHWHHSSSSRESASSVSYGEQIEHKCQQPPVLLGSQPLPDMQQMQPQQPQQPTVMLQSQPAQYLRQPQPGEPAAGTSETAFGKFGAAPGRHYAVVGALLCTSLVFLGLCMWDSSGPRVFAVSLDASQGHDLGLVLDDGEFADALAVVEVKPGLVEDWNMRHPQRRVLAGDQIVQVNGKTGDSCLLEEELWKLQPLALIVRPQASVG